MFKNALDVFLEKLDHQNRNVAHSKTTMNIRNQFFEKQKMCTFIDNDDMAELIHTKARPKSTE